MAAPRRILVVSAGMGAGHDAAAAELVRRLRAGGHAAEMADVLELGRGGQGRRLKQTYALLLDHGPWVYDAAMRFWRRWPRPLEAFTARGARGYESGLLEAVAEFRPDVVVSVFNLASQALGRLRASGRLDVPVVTYVTDPGAHPYWVHRAVDLHLSVLATTAEELRGYGAGRTAVVAPLVAPRFRAGGADRAGARAALGLPADRPVALVSAGSWAAGDVERTVTELADSAGGAVVPVTLCGRDDDLRRRLARAGAGIALGWTDDMVAVMAAADVLIDNAGGLTCWEAMVTGLPVVLYQPLPGHGRLNAEALERAGLARYPRDAAQLVDAVTELATATGPREPASFCGDAAEAVVGLLDPADPATASHAASRGRRR